MFHDTGGYPHEYPHDILVVVDLKSQLSIMILVFLGIVVEPSLYIYIYIYPEYRNIQVRPIKSPSNHHVYWLNPIKSPSLLLKSPLDHHFAWLNPMKSP